MGTPDDKPSLSLIGLKSTGPRPPRELGPHGLALWSAILNEFNIRDRAGLELLAQAAALLDRAESLSEQINADGAVLQTASAGLKSHPGIKDEVGCRTAVVRILEKPA
jgi:hypothetical protein